MRAEGTVFPVRGKRSRRDGGACGSSLALLLGQVARLVAISRAAAVSSRIPQQEPESEGIRFLVRVDPSESIPRPS